WRRRWWRTRTTRSNPGARDTGHGRGSPARRAPLPSPAGSPCTFPAYLTPRSRFPGSRSPGPPRPMHRSRSPLLARGESAPPPPGSPCPFLAYLAPRSRCRVSRSPGPRRPRHGSRFLTLADGEFGPLTSKTANSVIRYLPDRIAAVVDRATAGQTVQQVLGFGGDIPIVGSMREGLARKPDQVLIGIAPMGGRLPDEWRDWLLEALDAGRDRWRGLHTFLSDEPALAARAKARGRAIHDLRRPPASLPVASGKAKEVEPYVILTVGTDCNVGKMTSQL